MSVNLSKRSKFDISSLKKLSWPSFMPRKSFHIIFKLIQLALQALLQRSIYTRRVAKWGTMLGAFDIRCLLRMVVKGQVLANLVAEFTKELDQMGPKEVGMPEEGLMINWFQPSKLGSCLSMRQLTKRDQELEL